MTKEEASEYFTKVVNYFKGNMESARQWYMTPNKALKPLTGADTTPMAYLKAGRDQEVKDLVDSLI